MQMKSSDGQSEFSRVFNFAILGYSRNSWKLDARENIVFYSKCQLPGLLILQKEGSVLQQQTEQTVAMWMGGRGDGCLQ